MAVPRAGLCVVDPVAPGVTNRLLLSFPRFMRLSGGPRFGPAVAILAAAASACFLFAAAPPARAAILRDCPASGPCPSPSPSPIPVHAFLSLDVTSGDATTVINVTGGQFNPNQQVGLYWDDPSKVAGGATTDSAGSFNTRVKPFSADAPGPHKLCASVPPNPCATFTLVAPTPVPASPSPSPSASPSASPENTPAFTASPSPVAALSGFDVITSPPFVFLPIAGAFAILLSIGYWLFTVARRPRVKPMPSAAVVHRATRPDYTASFGAAPATPSPTTEPSAWSEHMPSAAPPGSAPVPPPPPPDPETPPSPGAPAAEWGPPVEWGTGGTDWGFPEPPQVDDDDPDIPKPTD
jgi:hypothetical protein